MRFSWLLVLVLAAACGPDDDGTSTFYTDTAPPPAATQDFYAPHKINSDRDWLFVQPGPGFACAAKRAGSLWCAGDNQALQFGVEAPGKTSTMVRAGDQYWSSLTASLAEQPFVCGITRGKRLECWGTPPGASQAMLRYQSGAGWSDIAAGRAHACGITGDGLYCWGTNEHHRVGAEGAERHPVRIMAGAWLSVAAGENHSCAVRADGTLWCWGAAEQAGAAGRTPAVPTQISSATSWIEVAAGAGHTCAVRTNGTLWCWGNAESGQLGVGVSNRPSTTPLQVGSGAEWVTVTAGANHSCAMKQSGKLYCWGDNGAGQLGAGSDGIRDVPTPVADTYDWNSVKAHGNTTCAVRVDGTLWCWGRVAAGLHDAP
jgi:alpha-tubulin suppressor-like RCC1 family protein